MVADPTRPSTWNVPSASKVSLSKADLIVLTFFGASDSWSNTDGMVRAALFKPHEFVTAVGALHIEWPFCYPSLTTEIVLSLLPSINPL